MLCTVAKHSPYVSAVQVTIVLDRTAWCSAVPNSSPLSNSNDVHIEDASTIQCHCTKRCVGPLPWDRGSDSSVGCTLKMREQSDCSSQYSAVYYSAVQYSTVQYSTV